jgi:hypothetical protein
MDRMARNIVFAQNPPCAEAEPRVRAYQQPIFRPGGAAQQVGAVNPLIDG